MRTVALEDRVGKAGWGQHAKGFQEERYILRLHGDEDKDADDN